MQYKGNPNRDGPDAHELAEYEKIVENKPDILDKPFIVHQSMTKYSKEGSKYTETVAFTMGTVPVLKTIELDLIDSYWYYPVIHKQIVATASVTEGTHPEYFVARNKNKK
jgi:hypothetical protein